MENPTPAPEHRTFRMTKGAYGIWWMYKWQPTVALVFMAAVGLTAGSIMYTEGFDVVISALFGIIAVLVIGFLYNILAKAKGWQKLSWHDIITSAGG